MRTCLIKSDGSIGNKQNVDVTISLHEFDEDYSVLLNRSIEQADATELVFMNKDEFMAYSPKK